MAGDGPLLLDETARSFFEDTDRSMLGFLGEAWGQHPAQHERAAEAWLWLYRSLFQHGDPLPGEFMVGALGYWCCLTNYRWLQRTGDNRVEAFSLDDVRGYEVSSSFFSGKRIRFAHSRKRYEWSGDMLPKSYPSQEGMHLAHQSGGNTASERTFSSTITSWSERASAEPNASAATVVGFASLPPIGSVNRLKIAGQRIDIASQVLGELVFVHDDIFDYTTDRRTWRTLATLLPDPTWAHVKMAEIDLAAGVRSDAEKQLSKLQGGSSLPAVQAALAQCALERGESRTAGELLLKAFKRSPYDAVISEKLRNVLQSSYPSQLKEFDDKTNSIDAIRDKHMGVFRERHARIRSAPQRQTLYLRGLREEWQSLYAGGHRRKAYSSGPDAGARQMVDLLNYFNEPAGDDGIGRLSTWHEEAILNLALLWKARQGVALSDPEAMMLAPAMPDRKLLTRATAGMKLEEQALRANLVELIEVMLEREMVWFQALSDWHNNTFDSAWGDYQYYQGQQVSDEPRVGMLFPLPPLF
jgi:hypothetical protein